MNRRALLLLGCALAGCSPPRLVAPLRYGVVPPTAAETPLRQSAPPFSPVAEVSDVPPRETVLPNGLRVLLVERHGYPVVASRLIVDRSSIDLEDAGGNSVSQMTYLYARGGSEDALERASVDRGRTGVTVGAGSSEDELHWYSHAPAQEIDESCALLARTSFGAQLTREEYELRSRTWHAAVKGRGLSLNDAEAIVLFGREHPYGYLDQDALLSLDAAESLHARLLQPTQATLLIVGDVKPEMVDASVSRWFGAWKATAPALPKRSYSAPLLWGPRVVVVRHRELEQRRAAVYARGPSPASDDMEALQVVATLLGSPETRLREEVREGMGASYDVAAPVIRQRSATWISVVGAYESTKAVAGVAASLRAIARLRAGDVTEDEMLRAREQLVAAWRAAMSTAEGAASRYAAEIVLGRGADRVRSFPQRIARVTTADVARVASLYLAPHRIHVAFQGEDRWLDADRLGMGEPKLLEPKP